MQKPPKLSLVIEPWTKDHDASRFTSDLASIKKYIQEQAHRDVSSYTSSVFVLTEPGDKVIRGYYSLSSLSIVFNELPTKVQKKLPRYPEASGILLGRLGVDRDYSQKLQADLGERPRLGELLLANAQIRSLKNSKDVGSALLVVDAELPSPEEQKAGARDPLPFYAKYGFVPLTANPRRVIKTMRAISEELNTV
ncbi:MAG: GNAT family N-acetyltransferase [Candidatus Obscuribacter sp.]|nr:GNAT family N-acetyltransferase [Candidatus Obscuribacter sp.]